MANNDNWPLYIEKTRNGQPRENLIKALKYFDREQKIGTCIDVGSGAGNDLGYLLEKGWTVSAFDSEEAAEKIILERFQNHPRLTFHKAQFQDIKWTMVDLINCSYVLPFCDADYFPILMQQVTNHILPGGRFAGNFFGTSHTWEHCTLVSNEDVINFFQGFEIEYINETKEYKQTVFEENIFFHNIALIARKID